MEMRLRELREKQDISQRQMAHILNISKSYYNYFETGERIIPLVRLNNYCNLFHLSSDYVLGITERSIVSKDKVKINSKLIGKRIKQIRKLHKMSQLDLAKLLNTSQSTISSYENGKTLILTAFVYEMSIKLNVSSDYIIGRSNTIKIIQKT